MLLLSIFDKHPLITIFLFIDGVIYNFIRYMYDIFMFLAGANIFDESDYGGIVTRIYLILGVVMMFALAYSLLKAVINPDEFAKGEKSFPNLIKNVVISLIIIVLLPTAFRYAMEIQNSIIEYDVIGKIVLPSGSGDVAHAGNAISATVYEAFLYPADGVDPSSITTSDGFFTTGTNFSEVRSSIREGESFTAYTNFAENVGEGELVYSMPFSTLAGLFVLWVILLFCFDLGIRVVKLLFFQIIAPIPVICRILPDGKGKDVWNNWLKKIIHTYLEVFIRLIVMYIGVYLIVIVKENLGDLFAADKSGLDALGQTTLAQVFVILGVIAFMRVAPKLIQEVFGIDSGDLDIGLKGLVSRLTAGGGLVAGTALGTAGLTGIRRFAGTKGNIRDKLKAGIGGTTSGLKNGISAGLGAKSFGDVRKNISDTTASNLKKADAKAEKKDAKDRAITTYMADHRVSKNAARVAVAKENMRDSFYKFAGIDKFDKYKKEMDFYDMIKSHDDKIDQSATDLLGKDKVRDSKKLLENAAGISGFSLSSAQQYYDMIRQNKYEELKGRSLKLLKENAKGEKEINIRSEQDLANYLTELKSQISQAERDTKKYLKEQGLQGDAGIELLTRSVTDGGVGIDLGDGEKRLLSSMAAQRNDMENILKERAGDLEKLNNEILEKYKDPSKIIAELGTNSNSWDNMDQLVKNAKQREVDIMEELNELQRRNSDKGNNNS